MEQVFVGLHVVACPANLPFDEVKQGEGLTAVTANKADECFVV
jgi:hypothetical protein